MAERRIKIEEITKIEGHANLTVEIENDELKRVIFGVHEGSRYFEAFMIGRTYRYLPELSGRICGICTVAHEIASVRAVEDALGIEVSEEVKKIRKLMLISSHIQSHILHLYFLALPDYVGVESVIELAGKDLDLVKKAFELKEASNYMTSLLGGRAVQPCTVIPGRMPKRIDRGTIERYLRKMKEIYPYLMETAELFLSLEYPSYDGESEYLTLWNGKNIPLYEGKLKTMENVFDAHEYGEHLKEYVVDYSTAKRSLLDGRDYMVGALARLNLNPYLRDESREIADKYGYKFPSNRVAWINAAQALENVHYALEAIEIAEDLREYEPSRVEIPRMDGEGVGAIEAPRGLLIHHYRIKRGKCEYVNIITPTAMNTESIERNLKGYLSEIVNEEDEVLKMEAEKIIRAYDPCISCSVHVIRIENVDKKPNTS
ncbi:coenzyme F420-reducing hydrogenase, alpha subunit [Aciduliprofundum sp. MAR08-339]|uniref:Ni/Fe hydrogenase subunit alpha n=1 Tax=Aciduliprofundum sp. (strain MAR08-339) TaxID=673860 RepID=UPI0002A4C75A|nr:coenzyme F420-reducing hydrogenase, alpha subunit [Aciduliprofundum sp. MAR08-339]